MRVNYYFIAAGILAAGVIFMKAYKPLGVRLNNPINIEQGNNWNGETKRARDDRFESFTHYKWGFRAGAKILRNYQRFYGLNTVRGLISRYAPSNENDTGNYIRFVAGKLGVGADDALPLGNNQFMARLLYVMSLMEVGHYYSEQQALEGVLLA